MKEHSKLVTTPLPLQPCYPKWGMAPDLDRCNVMYVANTVSTSFNTKCDVKWKGKVKCGNGCHKVI
jgi:hypothetical protein